MLFFLWPMLLTHEVGVFLCQMVSAAFFAVSAGAVLKRLPAPNIFNFLFRASVVLGGMLIFGVLIALVGAVSAISVYLGGISKASYAPFLVFGPPAAIFVIGSFCFWPMYALPVVWRWRANTRNGDLVSEEDWYGYHIWPGLKDSFQAALHDGNWFRYGISAVLAQWGLAVSLYFSSFPLMTPADVLRHALIGGLCLPCIHLIIVHNTYKALKTTKPRHLIGDPKKRRKAKKKYGVDPKSATPGKGASGAVLSPDRTPLSFHEEGIELTMPLPPPDRQEVGKAGYHKPWPAYDLSAERSDIKRAYCACDQAPRLRLGLHEQHLFPETWQSMHVYPGFTVAPWTPTKREQRIVFCSSCNRLWCLKYIGYEDAFQIRELSDSCLPIIGKSATPDKIIPYVLAEGYDAGGSCIDAALRMYFSIASYPLTETADLIISAIETNTAIGPTKDLLTFLRWVVLRAHDDRLRDPTGKKARSGLVRLKRPRNSPSVKSGQHPSDSAHPKLHVNRFGVVLDILNRPGLYEGVDPVKTAHIKFEIHLVLKDIVQHGFPPAGDVLSLSPEDKRKLTALTDPNQIVERCFETMAEMPAVLSDDHLGTIIESAVFLYEAITLDSRLSVRDINLVMALLNRAYGMMSGPEDRAGAAHHHLYQLLEKAYAYDIIPQQCRQAASGILNPGKA